MSLLLDALKKAAKDKAQATASDGGQVPGAVEETAAVSEPVSDTQATPELSLDDDSLDEAYQQATPELSLDDDSDDETYTQASDGRSDNLEQQQHEEQALSLEQQEVRGETSTVSDEALQMLVHKTNRAHRRSQKVVWLGVTLTSVIILLAGGYYFYSGMVTDVEALERKHNIALQKLNAEVVKRKDPKLVAGLTSKPQQAPAQQSAATVVDESAVSSEPPALTKPEPAPARQPPARSGAKPIELKKSSTLDPVSELLEAGWRSYNAGELSSASESYNRALAREPGNRDALLGLAAIAVAKDETAVAMQHYRHLLRLDPRDPLAAPALASLKRKASTTADLDGLDEIGLKQLLRYNPKAHHVDFALGNLKARQGQWPDAQQHYFDAWLKDPSNADYAYNIAISLEHIGKPPQAAEFYRRSLALGSEGAFSFDRATVEKRLAQLER